MCGRYAVTKSLGYLIRDLGLSRDQARKLIDSIQGGSFNIAPTTQVPVVRSTDAQREVLTMRWGLIPGFAAGVAGKYSTINCRIETTDLSPAFRSAWRRGQRCTIITMSANELMAEIHNDKQRMPAILNADDVEVWLTGTSEAARAVLQPFPSELMVAWPVTIQVNAPKNNGPELIQAVAGY